MLKRIMAWVLLVGFVFLIFNIISFGFYREISVVIYLVIAFAFLLTSRKPSGRNTWPAGAPGTKRDDAGGDTGAVDDTKADDRGGDK